MEFLLHRQRPEKLMRAHGHYTGNLGVFGEAGAAIAANGPYVQLPDSYTHSHTTPATISLAKSKLALLISGACAAGALLGTLLWIPLTSSSGSEPATIAATENRQYQTDLHLLASVSASPELDKKQNNMSPTRKDRVPASIGVSREQSAAISDMSIDPTLLIHSEHSRKVEQLNAQITSLQNEIRVLDNEALDLNSELLEMELQLVGLKEQTSPKTKTRIVYNFVNVPIGARLSTVETRTLTQDFIPTDDDEHLIVNSTPPEQSAPVQRAQSSRPLVPAEDSGSIRPEQPVRAIAPVQPKESVQFSISGESDQPGPPNYTGGREIAYDNESGFYLNSHFAPDDALSETDQLDVRDVVYPPIGPDNN